MSKVNPTTPWSTVLRPTSSMPARFRAHAKRGVFLGWSKDMTLIRVVQSGSATPATYSPDFWEVDDKYMNDREQIAELMGRIAESNEPTDIKEYRAEIDEIEKGMEL